MVRVLALDIAGNPFRWMTPSEAVRLYALDKVAWDLGDGELLYRGGTNRHGMRSEIRAKFIIALADSDIMASMQRDVLPLGDHNELLFRRDLNICAYCGEEFPSHVLTRDHIVPRSRGGLDTWENCVTADRACNQAKGSLSLEAWGRELLYVPYAPNRWEHMILCGRDILADQMEYLRMKVGRHSRQVA